MKIQEILHGTHHFQQGYFSSRDPAHLHLYGKAVAYIHGNGTVSVHDEVSRAILYDNSIAYAYRGRIFAHDSSTVFVRGPVTILAVGNVLVIQEEGGDQANITVLGDSKLIIR